MNSYQWIFGDGDSSDAFSPIHLFEEQGEYIVNLQIDGMLNNSEYSDTITIHSALPNILNISDIPNDNGGVVLVEFNGSGYDVMDRNEFYTVEMNINGNWVSANFSPPYGEESYAFLVNTLTDSSAESDGMTEFRILASMDEGVFISSSAFGYSVDNINPSTPTDLAFTVDNSNAEISWQASIDPDFHYYEIELYGQETEYTTEPSFIAPYMDNIHGYKIKTYDYNGNVSEESANFVFYQMNLSYGNNLVSFPILPNGIIDPLELIEMSGCNVNFILGQGQGLFNTNMSWSGNLNNIVTGSSYWINITDDCTFDVVIENQDFNDCPVYEISYGNNLISYTGVPDANVLDALGPFSDCVNFIFSQGQGFINSVDGWSGNLTSMKHKNGYWLNIGNDCAFNEEERLFSWNIGNGCEEPVAQSLSLAQQEYNIPFEFQVNQSTEQAFYLIKEIEDVENDDMITAYCGEQLVGSAMWDGEYTAIPVMGRDISEQTIGFCETGEQPIFTKIDPLSNENIELIGDIPGFTNLGVYTLDKLESVDNMQFPTEWSLAPAYPNPFNPVTTIKIGVPFVETLRVTSLQIFDINGRIIETLINGEIEPGNHAIDWNATGMPSGVYFVKMVGGDYIQSQKIVLMK